MVVPLLVVCLAREVSGLVTIINGILELLEWVIVGMESVEGEIQVSDMDDGFLSSTRSSSHCSCHL